MCCLPTWHWARQLCALVVVWQVTAACFWRAGHAAGAGAKRRAPRPAEPHPGGAIQAHRREALRRQCTHQCGRRHDHAVRSSVCCILLSTLCVQHCCPACWHACGHPTQHCNLASCREPSTDLAIALAIASSYYNRGVPKMMAVIGEMGLAGELRCIHTFFASLCTSFSGCL